MPQTLAASIAVSVKAQLDNSLDLGGASYPLAISKSVVLTNGTGANQAKDMFTDRRTLAASTSEDLDLSGVLTNAFGASIAFTKIRALIISSAADNVNDVVIGGHATAACASFFGDVTDKLKVKPGGTVALIAPDAAGYAVTAVTADLLKITNGGAGTPVTYDIVIIGTT